MATGQDRAGAGMTLHRPTIAWITIPHGALACAATEFVRDTASQMLFDHSRRVFL